MTAVRHRGYDRPVAAVRDALRRAAASFALLIGFLHPAVANAASGSFLMGDQSVVQVLSGARSQITVKAWDRPNVQFDTDDESVQVERRPITFGTAQNPLSVQIPVQNIVVRDPTTGAQTRGTLPPEEFPYASDFRAGVHDSVRIVTADDTHLTVMVPATTALLDTRIRNGQGLIDIEDYHGGTLFVASGGGCDSLVRHHERGVRSVDQRPAGRDRLELRPAARPRQRRELHLRTRSGAPDRGNDGVRQHRATTTAPSIRGWRGSSSTYGSIAIGVASGAQVSARSTDGRVYSMWDRRTPLDQRGDNDVSATIGGGGPVVNALTGRGNVYLYDGTIAITPDARSRVAADPASDLATVALTARAASPRRVRTFPRLTRSTALRAPHEQPARRPAPHRDRLASCDGS